MKKNRLYFFLCTYVFLVFGAYAIPPSLAAQEDKYLVRDITVEEVMPTLKKPDAIAIAIDVRTSREYIRGHIEGAKNIDFLAENFRERLMSLDREATYIVYCKSGSRSKRAVEEFRRLEFKNILHLQSGYDSWVDSAYAERY